MNGKLNEIMIFRSNENAETRLKILQVDDTVLSKLTKIRGNLYKDDPRLKIVKDHPTPEPQTKDEILPEMKARAEASWLAHCMTRDTGAKSAPSSPEPQKPMTFDEQIQHDWSCNPNIRKEFISLASYTAYCRAVRDRRAKIAGGCVVR